MTAIIIEDEPLAVIELEDILKELAPDIRIIACPRSVREAVDVLQAMQPDVIFSDIHLGDGQSFDIFRRVNVSTPVVFITAYDEYALQAFKNQGIDYILKPFDREEISRAIDKVRGWFGEGGIAGEPKAEQGYQERFLVMLGARIKSIPVTDVAYFMADGKYLMLYTREGAGYIIDQTISGIEKKLNPQIFFRVNRKFMISYSSIREMVRYSNSRIKIILSPLPPEKAEVFVSADRLREFKVWLNK